MRRRQILTLATAIPLVGVGAPVAIAAPSANLWDYWSAHDPQSRKTVDHARWNRFLSRYVMPSGDGINRVAYGNHPNRRSRHANGLSGGSGHGSGNRTVP